MPWCQKAVAAIIGIVTDNDSHLSFVVGDIIMATVKGHPAWPAEIIGKSGQNCHVLFFGTQQNGKVPNSQVTMLEPSMIVSLRSDSKATRHKKFIVALDEANQRLEGIAGTSQTVPDPKGPSVGPSASPKM